MPLGRAKRQRAPIPVWVVSTAFSISGCQTCWERSPPREQRQWRDQPGEDGVGWLCGGATSQDEQTYLAQQNDEGLLHAAVNK